MGAPRKPLRSRLLAFGVQAAMYYVAANVAMVTCVTTLATATVMVEVVDEATSQAIAGATVSIDDWQLEAPSGQTTYAGVRAFHQQHLWMWPRIGTFDWRDATLSVQAAGYTPSRAAMAQLLPDLPLANANGRVRVRLRRS